MIRTETFEAVEADETFLDLVIESREVILSLGSPSSDTKSPLRLDRDAFDRQSECLLSAGVSSNGRCVRMS